jgi:translation initiation factor 4A
MAEEKKDYEFNRERPPITTDLETNWFESVDSFHKLGLKEELLRGIYGKKKFINYIYFHFRLFFHFFLIGFGFEKPSPIQQIGIIPIIKLRDTIAQA